VFTILLITLYAWWYHVGNNLYICSMKVYAGLQDNNLLPCVYTGLVGICKAMKVSYDSAARGKRVWIKDGVVDKIVELEVIKIKGRGQK